MEIIFLGTCSAGGQHDFQTNLLIRVNGSNMLVDAGDDIRWSMKREKLTYKDIKAAYISHGHGDHYHGLEWLGDSTLFSGAPLIRLYVEGQFADDLWTGGLYESMKGLQGNKYGDDVSLKTYFNVHKVQVNGFFIEQGVRYDIVQMIHVTSKYSHCSSYGLMFTKPDINKRIFITTDCQYAPQSAMDAFLEECDYCIHDCETTPFRSGVHPNWMDIVNYPPHIKNKIILVHYNFDPTTEWEAWNAKAIEAGFIGFARPQDRFDDIIIKHNAKKEVI